ncbi:MAG: CYTH domain-containing protein [Flavobacteriales bacterium]
MKEIERKFLVATDAWKTAKCIGQRELKQAYLLRESDRSVRIRVTDNMAYFTIKLGTGLTRSEFEYEIPQEEANDIIAEANLPCLHKTRYYIQFAENTWELDVFHGALEGLLIAELELNDEHQVFERPDWLGEEVTFDPSYLNSNLIERLTK